MPWHKDEGFWLMQFTYNAVLNAEAELILDVRSLDKHLDHRSTRHQLQPHDCVMPCGLATYRGSTQARCLQVTTTRTCPNTGNVLESNLSSWKFMSNNKWCNSSKTQVCRFVRHRSWSIYRNWFSFYCTNASVHMIWCDRECYFNVFSKADKSQLSLIYYTTTTTTTTTTI